MIAALLACGHEHKDAASNDGGAASAASAIGVADAADVEHLLPHVAKGALAPSLVEVTQRGDRDPGRTLADVDACGSCHADAAHAWSTSAHAFASFTNPLYRVSIERLRRDRGKSASKLCAGCHDVALLVDGKMDGEIDPTDTRAHSGVSCRVCHGIASVRADGNGAFALDARPIPVPKEGDAASVLEHRARVALSPLRTDALCNTCHRVVLDETAGNAHKLHGQDEATAFAKSAFAGSHAERIDDEVMSKVSCRSCHMQREPEVRGDPGAKVDSAGKRTIASHRFLGGHSFLAAMRKDEQALEMARAFLTDAARVEVARVSQKDGGTEIAVVVRNERVGHKFPGGTIDAVDTWLEVELEADGKIVATAGQADDETRHRLGAALLDAEGKPLTLRETHLFRAVGYDQTIGARDAAVVRYFAPVSGARLRVRLLHRSRMPALVKAACEDHKTPRGQAFYAAAPRFQVDVCIPQPITEVARAEAMLDPKASDGVASRTGHPAPLPEWRRTYAEGLGVLRGLSEESERARVPFERAVSAAPEPLRGAGLFGLAQMHAVQEDYGKAIAVALEAERLSPHHPALERLRGDASASTFRLEAAERAYSKMSETAPLDVTAWAKLAVSRSALGEDKAALVATHRGLLLSPRDSDLLRVQSLSRPDDVSARDAFLEFRTPDEAPKLRALCNKNVPGCARERVLVHTHPMTVLSGG